jgi:SAM-dependent methyltransferase
VSTDWLALWQELTIANPHSPDSGPIKRYKTHATQQKERPDPLLDYVQQSIDCSMTVLDIGAGNGRWSIPLAKAAKTVTAIEPDSEMLKLLRDNLKKTGTKIVLKQSNWEEAIVEVHDIAVSAHAIYSSPNFAFFVNKMEQHARKICYLEIRLPPVEGIIGALSKEIYDRPFDSTNAVIAYNALYSLGIYVNILVEKEIYHWTNNTLEEALMRAKRHLHLESNSTYDQLILDTLCKRLVPAATGYIWPDGMRSALLWWQPRK